MSAEYDIATAYRCQGLIAYVGASCEYNRFGEALTGKIRSVGERSVQVTDGDTTVFIDPARIVSVW